MNKNKTTIISILIAGTLALIILSFADTSDETNASNVKGSYAIFPVIFPDSITFAGEVVPIENFDVAESLDRELMINTYWQSQTLLFIKRCHRYFPIIEPILKANGIPDDFKYLAVAESGLSNTSSPAGAKGFWQFLQGTATDYNLTINNEIDERYHLEKSTEAACKFLNDSYAKFGSWAMAAASYNMGRRNITQQINRQKSTCYYDLVLGEETGRYVYRIVALKLILDAPEKFGFHVSESEMYPEIPYHKVTVDTTIHQLADFAFQMGTNYKILKELNPWLRENVLTNPKQITYEIKIPEKNFRNTKHSAKFFPIQDTIE